MTLPAPSSLFHQLHVDISDISAWTILFVRDGFDRIRGICYSVRISNFAISFDTFREISTIRPMIAFSRCALKNSIKGIVLKFNEIVNEIETSGGKKLNLNYTDRDREVVKLFEKKIKRRQACELTYCLINN